jgi:prevent-host-death family protein
MDETITAGEANRAFSRLLRNVRDGRSYLVTVHGRPVARLVPAEEDDERERRIRRTALLVLIERVRRQQVVDIGRWTRDELYQR